MELTVFYSAWLEMRDDVILTMNRVRSLRLARRRLGVLSERTSLFRQFLIYEFGEENNLPSFVPAIRTLVSIPSVKDILISDFDLSLSLENFAPLRHSLLSVLAELQQRQVITIQRWIEEKTDLRLPDNTNLFELAITTQIGETSGQDQPLDSYFLGAHRRCFRTNFEFQDTADSSLSAVLYEDCMNMISQQCHADTSYMYAQWKMIEYIIKATGEDPASVTSSVMNRKEMRWYCTTCFPNGEVRLIMDWNAAVSAFNFSYSACLY